jgi:NAD+ kinase
MTYAIVARDDEQSKQLQTKLEIKLNLAGYRLDEHQPEVLIFIGGDGTFLRSLQSHITRLHKTLFVGIHTGTLGFFCEFHKEQLDLLVQSMKTFVKKASAYHLLEIDIEYKKYRKSYYAVNEVRIENPFHTFVSEVLIDDQPFQVFRGTGLIVSSTLGSSAYNKSLGGALIDVPLSTLQLTEMATIQNNAYRSLGSSLVLDKNRTITFKGDFRKAIVGYDYLLADIEEEIKAVHVRYSKKTFKLYHQQQHSYYETIKRAFIKNI